MHGWGACMVGAHAWQGVCVVGGMHGRGVCVAGGHAWQGACVAGGMHGRGHACPPPADTMRYSQ